MPTSKWSLTSPKDRPSASSSEHASLDVASTPKRERRPSFLGRKTASAATAAAALQPSPLIAGSPSTAAGASSSSRANGEEDERRNNRLLSGASKIRSLSRGREPRPSMRQRTVTAEGDIPRVRDASPPPPLPTSTTASSLLSSPFSSRPLRAKRSTSNAAADYDTSASSSITPSTSAELDASMLSPPQPAFLSTSRRSSNFSSGYREGNASSASFASSAPDSLSPPTSLRDSDDGVIAIHGSDMHHDFNSPSASFAKSPLKATGGKSPSGIKGFGRRLFGRSSHNVSPTTPGSQQSETDSIATSHSSPLLTPVTPPRIHGLPGTKGAFSLDGGIPQLPPLAGLSPSAAAPPTTLSSLPLQSLGSALTASGALGVSAGAPASEARASESRSESPSSWTASTTDRYGSLSLHHHMSPPSRSSTLPALPEVPLPSSNGHASPLVHRAELPSVSVAPVQQQQQQPQQMPDDMDTDFLRAVLFGLEGDGETSHSASPSIPSRSTSAGQFPRAVGSASLSASASMRLNAPRRPGQGPVRLTSAEVQALATEEARPKRQAWKSTQRSRPGLFGPSRDEDSEDEYGEEDEDLSTATASPARSPARKDTALLSPGGAFPSSMRHSKSQTSLLSQGGTEDEFHDATSDIGDTSTASRAPSPPRSSAALDTPAKRALYTCTLLKVHPQLAVCFKASLDGSTLLPGAAAVLAAPPADVRFPRSINRADMLASHSSSTAFSRDLGVALARSDVMRKLRNARCVLPIAQEVELGWFQRKYGSELISPEAIAAGLAKGPGVSPEALARPPMAAPSGSKSLASQEPEHNGVSTWAARKPYMERIVVSFAEEESAAVGEVLSERVLPTSLSLAVGKRVSLPPALRRIQAVKPAPLALSPRIRVLAGLPIEETAQEKTRIRKFRKREAQRTSSEPAGVAAHFEDERTVVLDVAPAAAAAARGVRPGRETKAPPPWIAQRPHNAKRASTLPVPAPVSPVRSASPESPSVSVTRSPSLLVAPSPAAPRRGSSYNGTSSQPMIEEEGQSSDEEDVPLSMLNMFRIDRERKVHEEALQRERSEAIRREEERKRVKAEERVREEQKRALRDARERRKHTGHSAVLASHSYGAGDPLSPSRALLPASPSSPAGLARTPSMATLSPPAATTAHRQSQRLSVLPPSASSNTLRHSTSANALHRSDSTAPTRQKPASLLPPVQLDRRTSLLTPPHSPSAKEARTSQSYATLPRSTSHVLSPERSPKPRVSALPSSATMGNLQPQQPLLQGLSSSPSRSSQMWAAAPQQNLQRSPSFQQQQGMPYFTQPQQAHAAHAAQQLYAQQQQQQQMAFAQQQQHRQSSRLANPRPHERAAKQVYASPPAANAQVQAQRLSYAPPQPLVTLGPRAVPASATQARAGWH